MLDKFLTDLFPASSSIKSVRKRLYWAWIRDDALGQQAELPLPPEPPRSEKEAYRKWC